MIMAGIHSMDMMPIMTTEDTEMVAVVEVVVDTGEAIIIMAEDDIASNSNIIRAEEVDKDIMETIDEMDGDIRIGIHSNTTGRVDMDILAAVIR